MSAESTDALLSEALRLRNEAKTDGKTTPEPSEFLSGTFLSGDPTQDDPELTRYIAKLKNVLAE